MKRSEMVELIEELMENHASYSDRSYGMINNRELERFRQQELKSAEVDGFSEGLSFGIIIGILSCLVMSII